MTRTEDAKMRARGVVTVLRNKLKNEPSMDVNRFSYVTKKVIRKWGFSSVNAFTVVAQRHGLL